MNSLPSTWETITFEDAFERMPKSGIKAGEGKEKGKYKFFTSSSEQTLHIDEAVFDGEFLIFGTGGNPSIHHSKDKFSTSTDCWVMKGKHSDLDLKYVYYFFKGNISLLQRGFRGAGLKHLSRHYLNAITIPKPPPETQRKIVSILERAEKLKAMRVQADELTSEFLKAVFYEMFEDIEFESFDGKVIEIIDGDRGVNYPHGSDFSDYGHCLFLNTGNVRNNGFNFEKSIFITKEKSAQLRKGKAQINDVILTTRGTIGNVALYDKTVPFEHIRINSGMVLLRPNPMKISPKYLFTIIQMPKIQNQFKRITSGSAQPQLPITVLKKINLPLPPIELQNKFAKIVEKVESIKQQQSNSRKQIDDLFNVLMRNAFNGELVK